MPQIVELIAPGLQFLLHQSYFAGDAFIGALQVGRDAGAMSFILCQSQLLRLFEFLHLIRVGFDFLDQAVLLLHESSDPAPDLVDPAFVSCSDDRYGVELREG